MSWLNKVISFIVLLLLILIVLGYAKFASDESFRERLLANPQAARVLKKLVEYQSGLGKMVGIQEKLLSPEDLILEQGPGEKISLYFKDGSTMEGELIKEAEDKYTVKWGDAKFVIYTDQVDRIERKKPEPKEKTFVSEEVDEEGWPYQNDILVRLTNGVVLDARIIKVEKDKLTLLYLTEEGGQIEQLIERSRVEYLIFKPINNIESRQIEKSLKELFPKMKFYKEGSFTIITDSYATWVKEYQKTLREAYTNIYLAFFELFKDRKPKIQNFLAIFDDRNDFIGHAVGDGVPGWRVGGYFMPSKEVLYLYNVLGDRFSESLFEAFVGESGKKLDDIVDRAEERGDKRYYTFVKGWAEEINEKYWEAYNYYKGLYRESTMSTLRHEFTHEIFHNWGLQNIKISKYAGAKEELKKKMKEILETKDYRKKAELLKTLIFLRGEALDVKAANSWLAEGTATYCETDTFGGQNNRWLFLYQQMAREGPIYPLESLTFHRIGSFPGVCSKAMLYLYAQSWAFVSFLMERYPEQFMEYQKRMADEVAQEHQDIVWLLEALGKDLKTVEKEFVEYMDTYEKIEDPDIETMVKLRSIFRD